MSRSDEKLEVLVVEDSPSYMREIERTFGREFPELPVRYVSDLESAIQALTDRRADLVVTDVIYPLSPEQAKAEKTDSRAGFKLLDHLVSRSPSTRVVVLSGQDKQTAVDLLIRYRQVADYMFKDTPWKEVAARIRRIVDELEETRRLAGGMQQGFVGETPKVARIKALIRQVGPSDATVLIQGESGTGKELVARAVHNASGRWRGPFIPVNCAALTENLLESELFGHKKGAFTGATDDRAGKFEAAQGGTLFLDEIGELPLTLQPKLLRALQEHEVERLGENKIRKVDVRFVAATNRDLRKLSQEGKFREDLYFRVNVFPFDLPALRDRPDDIPHLMEHFRLVLNEKMGKRVAGFTPHAIERLKAMRWAGNIRELQNLLERVFILTSSDIVDWPEFALWSLDEGATGFEVAYPASSSSYLETKKSLLEAFDRKFFTTFLAKNHGQIEKTADEIGYNRKDLRLKMKELGLVKEDFQA